MQNRKIITKKLEEIPAFCLEGELEEIIFCWERTLREYEEKNYYNLETFWMPDKGTFFLYGDREETTLEYNKRIAIKKKNAK
jgi:hypothetical protein